MPRLEFTYRSRFFTSIKEACKHYDVSYVLTRKHMKDYHISVGEALDIERNKIKDHNGVSFRTYREMCDFHGIPYRRFQTRFYHYRDKTGIRRLLAITAKGVLLWERKFVLSAKKEFLTV